MKGVIVDNFSIYRERKERYPPEYNKSKNQIKDLEVRDWYIPRRIINSDSYLIRNGKLIKMLGP